MELINKNEKEKLYLKVKVSCGYPLRPFELKNKMMDTLLEMAIEDYSSIVNEWLVHQNWINIEGLDKGSSDFLSAFTTKTNDYMKSFTFAYSKQVGLGTNAPAARGWELKKDFITTKADTQHYIIPAGREINQVLWETPPSIGGGMIDPFAVNNWSAGTAGWGYMGRPAMFIQPVYSILATAQDRRMKQKILQSTLTYRITGLETGEKVLHLYPIPGTRNEISGRWGKHYEGRKVWYWYYDTKNGKERDKCLKENDDVVKLPSDAPTKILIWEKLNPTAQQQIRDLFIAKCKITIGGVRGFYTGEVASANKQLTLDYRHLLDEGEKLEADTKKIVRDQLDKLSQSNLTKERAEIAENVNTERRFQPPKHPFILF